MTDNSVTPLLSVGRGGCLVFLLFAAALYYWWHVADDSRAESRRRLAVSSAEEVIPAVPIQLSGNVAIAQLHTRPDNLASRENGGKVQTACDNLCSALLDTPGVDSVTVFQMNSDRVTFDKSSEFARTFRLVEKKKCTKPSVVPIDVANQDAWAVRLATEICIQALPPLSQFDFTIRESYFSDFGEDYDSEMNSWLWTLQPLSVRIFRFDIFDRSANRVLTWVDASTLAMAKPVFPAVFNGLKGEWDFVFGWGRILLRNHPYDDDQIWSLKQILFRHTNLKKSGKSEYIDRAVDEISGTL
jgi:hypothetical protein